MYIILKNSYLFILLNAVLIFISIKIIMRKNNYTEKNKNNFVHSFYYFN